MTMIVYRRSKPSIEPGPILESPPPSDSLKLTDQYIALLILIFTKAGLLDVRDFGALLSISPGLILDFRP